jgi:hypothetical protein
MPADCEAGTRAFIADDVDLCREVDRSSFAMQARQEKSLMVLRPVDPHHMPRL